MELEEFNGRARTFAIKMIERVPSRYAEGFEVDVLGGEYGEAIRGLVKTLVDDQVLIDTDEEQELKELAGYLGISPDELTDLCVMSIPPG